MTIHPCRSLRSSTRRAPVFIVGALALSGFLWSGCSDRPSPMEPAAASPAQLSENDADDALAGGDGLEGPRVWTEKDDYVPHEPVYVQGTGFTPGEAVVLSFVEDPPVHAARTFTVTADSLGSFEFEDFAPDDHDAGMQFVLTATGQDSGLQAQTSFMDSVAREGAPSTNHNGSGSASSAVLVISAPALSGGDVLIGHVVLTKDISSSHTICPPADWTSIRRNHFENTYVQETFYYVAAGSEPVTSHSWHFKTNATSCDSGATVNRLSGKGASGGIIRFSGVDPDAPIDAHLGSSGGSSGPYRAPSVTTTQDGAHVLRFFGAEKKDMTIGPAAGRLYTISAEDPEERSAAAFESSQATAGPTGTFDATFNTSAEWVAQTVTLRMAAAPGPADVSFTISDDVHTYDGTAKGVTVTSDPPGVGFTVSYSQSGSPVASPTNAGTYQVLVESSDAAYAGSESGTLTIEKAAQVISWSDPAPITTGTELGATQLNATLTTGDGALTYTPAAGTVLAAETHTLRVDAAETANYEGAFKEVSITVGKAAQVISWSDPADITYGTALSGTQLNATLTTGNGALTYDPPSGTVLSVGTHTLRVEAAETATFAAAFAEVSITVNKATQVISWSDPAPITTGTELGATQLNATLTTGDGALTYTPSAGTVLPVGTHTLRVDAAETANYEAASKEVSITVGKAAQVISWDDPAAIVYGTPLSGTQLNASLTVGDGTLTYDPAVGTLLDAGTHTLRVDAAATANYAAAFATVELVVNKATPVISWADPADIVYGTALGDSQLNASSNVAGAFAYTPASGTVLDAGADQILSVDFTPGDTGNYDEVLNTTASITVLKAAGTIELSNLVQAYTGYALEPDVTTNPAGLNVDLVYKQEGYPATPKEVGVYHVVASIDDVNHEGSAEAFLVIYDPSAGFITGGGWIHSPSGACTWGECGYGTVGRANFGFNAKYKRGANEPDGQTQFQFQAGNLNFHSSWYDWLVVAGHDRAKFKGTGTINGQGQYGFMITGIDGSKSSNGGTDSFRIKIWDASGYVVYDNQMGKSDDGYDATVLGGGSIRIHQEGGQGGGKK